MNKILNKKYFDGKDLDGNVIKDNTIYIYCIFDSCDFPLDFTGIFINCYFPIGNFKGSYNNIDFINCHFNYCHFLNLDNKNCFIDCDFKNTTGISIEPQNEGEDT